MLAFFQAANRTFHDHFDGSVLPFVGNTVTSGGSSNKNRNSKFINTDGIGLPDLWASFGGLTATIAGTGTATLGGASVPTIDVTFSGTAAVAGVSGVRFDTTDVAIAVGQTWTISGYYAHVAGTLTGVTNTNIFLEYYQADGTTWVDGAYATTTTASTTLTRYSSTKLVPALGTRGTPSFAFNYAAGTYNFTVRLAGVQIEQAASAGTLVQTQPGDEIGGQSSPGKWYTRFPWGKSTIINNEQQYYPDIRVDGTAETGGVQPFSIGNSILTITSTIKAGGATHSQPYTSGCLSTASGGPGTGPFSFDQLFGYWEIRCRWFSSGPVLNGQGMWMGFWLMPSQIIQAPYAYGEIDIVEWIGLLAGYAATMHYTGPGGVGVANTQDFPLWGGDVQPWNFQTYGVEWRRDKITWYLNRKIAIGSSGNPVSFDITARPEFLNYKYCMLIQSAMGGNWPGPVQNNNIFPVTHEVDWVAVYDKLPF